MFMTNFIKRDDKLRIAHKLTKRIVNNTGVDYKTQFGITLKFVCNSTVQEIFRAFILWFKGENYLCRIKDNIGVATECAKEGFLYVGTFGKYELYVNNDWHGVLVKKLHKNFFKLRFIDKCNMEFLLKYSDDYMFEITTFGFDTSLNTMQEDIRNNIEILYWE